MASATPAAVSCSSATTTTPRLSRTDSASTRHQPRPWWRSTQSGACWSALTQPDRSTTSPNGPSTPCAGSAEATRSTRGAQLRDEIVHGIPSPRTVLREGDIVSIDCGAIVEGYHGDAAVTVPVGRVTPELTELMRVCEGSMWAGFAAARLGGRLSDIGAAVERHVWPHGYGVVEEYVGHGIGTEMHQDPQVPNYGRPGRGPRLVQGLVLAVEPMVNLGGRHTRLLDDGWTVVTRDGRPSAHFEHTFTLTEAGPWVLTALDGGKSRLTHLLAAPAAG